MDKNTVKPLEELLDSVRDIDGFPIAKDEKILNLSDPPFYTACPNPYIKKFIEEYGEKFDSNIDDYHRTPFIGDVSEGKNDPIYTAHSYHTKVPPRAIKKFIEHYTKPGEIVFDGFCGSGMTGVAAKLCGRNSILLDLAPAAMFISYNYNIDVDIQEFSNEIESIFNEVKNEVQWMYETNHTINKSSNNQKIDVENNKFQKGTINYTIWSDVFICPYCKNEYIFWETAVKENGKKILDDFYCPYCKAKINKSNSERSFSEKLDTGINKNVKIAKQVPVLINYKFKKKKFEKKPDKDDIELINKIEKMQVPYEVPNQLIPKGDKTNEPKNLGIYNIHNLYIKRSLWSLSSLYNKICKSKYKLHMIPFFQFLTSRSMIKLYKFRKSGGGQPTGNLYIPSLQKEFSFANSYPKKFSQIIKGLTQLKKLSEKSHSSLSIQSSTDLSNIPSDSIDYIFVDPPFGYNIMYSELNFISESWYNLFENNTHEAIINKSQYKKIKEYKDLITKSFKEFYRILKPNRWITVEFHNSKAAIWNSIQESITRSGFIIAQVVSLDKKQGTYNQQTSPGSVDKDLIISAYKPNKIFERSFLKNSGKNMEFDFVNEQLSHLPIEPNIERTEKMLYSKMLAHYVQNGFKIRFNASDFYKLLSDNFIELDGYWFLPNQVKIYNEWKSKLSLDDLKKSMQSQQTLFVSDEKSSLTWLYHFLKEPKNYGDIYTAYQRVVTTTNDVVPELKELLDNNFILENGKYRRPLNKEEKEEINQNRDKELDRAFNKLLTRAKEERGKIKQVRREAVIHGFTKCYQQGRYNDILKIADKLQSGTLESSGEIMDFVDIARIKTKGKKNIEDF